ncbi:MAG: DUF6306 domain-containing protein [Alphaproteobacteria bacterium]
MTTYGRKHDRAVESREALLDLLNLLLECERAGARGVGELSRSANPEHRPLLSAVARDEARYCAMLTGHIRRLGGRATRRTGAFYGKLMGTDGFAARIGLLDRGQGWVVRKLEDSLPRIDDAALRADLREMIEVHQRNIASCNAIAPDAGGKKGGD